MILETKLTLPQPKAGALLRTGLIDLIKNNLDKKLILITAGAGYGKTTLLGQLVKHAALPAVFYDLDNKDSDLLTFFTYLTTGLNKLSPGLASCSRDLLESATANRHIGTSHELLFGTLINELVEKCSTDLYIVLDDYQHLAAGSPAHRALEYFIDRMPAATHVIIASRVKVEYQSLAKWKARQDAFVLPRKGMAFTKGELLALLSVKYGQTSDEDLAERILDCTEGWITGIQLGIAQAKASRPDGIGDVISGYRKALSSAGGMFRYFVDEIYQREPAAIQDFMKRSSFLDCLSDEACEQILNIKDATGLLKSLEKRNLFVSSIGGGEYKYHRLFRDFLQEQAGAAEARPVLLKAARYHLSKGKTEYAVDCFLKAGEWQKAADIIEMMADDLIAHSRFTLIDGWLTSFSEEYINNEPRLLYWKGRLCQYQNRLQEAMRLYARAEELINGSHVIMNQQVKRYLLSRFLSCRGELLLAEGQCRAALGLLKKAQAICPRNKRNSTRSILNAIGLAFQSLGEYKKAKACFIMAARSPDREQYSISTFIIESNLAWLYYKQGDMKSADRTFKSIFQRGRRMYFNSIGVVFANAANAALAVGDIGSAEDRLKEGTELCSGFDDLRSLASLHNSQGALYMHQGKWEPAGKYLEMAAAEFIKSNWANVEFQAYLNLIRLYRYKGDNTRLEKYLAAAAGLEDTAAPVMRLDLQIERAFCCLASSDYAGADRILKTTIGQAGLKGYVFELFLGGLGRAAAAFGLGRKKTAVGWLIKSARLSRLKGYDGILIREIRNNRDLAAMTAKARRVSNTMAALNKRIFCAADASLNIRVNVRMFGPLSLSLENAGELPLGWKSRKQASLLAYLIINRSRLCFREELMDAFWPQFTMKQAEQSLYAKISEIKRIVSAGFVAAGAALKAPIIIHQERGYRANPAIDFWVDAEEFVRNHQLAMPVADGNKNGIEALSRCIEICRDGFLINLGDNWCKELREKYDMMFSQAVLAMARRQAGVRAYEKAIEYYRFYIEWEKHRLGLREDIRREYWETLRAAGRRQDIADDYKEMVKTLKNIFNAAPQLETEMKYKELIP